MRSVHTHVINVEFCLSFLFDQIHFLLPLSEFKLVNGQINYVYYLTLSKEFFLNRREFRVFRRNISTIFRINCALHACKKKQRGKEKKLNNKEEH